MTPVQIYTPYAARIQELRVETRDVKTLRLVFQDAKIAEGFSFRPGQFVELSVAGEGEATFCLASSPEERGYVECSVKRVGLVTEAIHRLDPSALVGLRGPYGNSFPLEQMEGRDLVFVAGGIGLAALRSLIKVVLAQPQKYGSILILYGARSVADLVYREELEQWRSRKDLKTVLTVDPGS
jgi:sulfhydrogenase subunit gamma (sulfur reductase)